MAKPDKTTFKINNMNTGSQQQNRDRERRESDETPIYLTGDSTLQTPSEDAKDSAFDPRQDTSMEPSSDDLHETTADRLAGSDRAGTAERKENDTDDQDNEDHPGRDEI